MTRRLELPCDELRVSYLAGQSIGVLARRHMCSPTTISKYLRECGVALRPSRFVPAEVDPVLLRRAYLDDRLPIAALAALFGVSASTIGNKRRQYGIPLRPRRAGSAALEEQELALSGSSQV
jgi:hypothetical protein